MFHYFVNQFSVKILNVLLFQYYLKMDGRGFYEFKPITSETTEFGS
jgi:hypothetical protein